MIQRKEKTKRVKKKPFNIRRTHPSGRVRKQLDDYRRRLTSDGSEEHPAESTDSESFLQDAAEGIEALNQTGHMDAYVQQLNAELARTTGRIPVKSRRSVKNMLNLPLIILIFLLLLLLAYWVVVTGIKTS